MASIDTYTAVLASLETLLATETAAQAAGQFKPTYSLDGVSYSWLEWEKAITDRIVAVRKLMQASQPTLYVSRGRSSR